MRTIGHLPCLKCAEPTGIRICHTIINRVPADVVLDACRYCKTVARLWDYTQNQYRQAIVKGEEDEV